MHTIRLFDNLILCHRVKTQIMGFDLDSNKLTFFSLQRESTQKHFLKD